MAFDADAKLLNFTKNLKTVNNKINNVYPTENLKRLNK